MAEAELHASPPDNTKFHLSLKAAENNTQRTLSMLGAHKRVS